MSTEGLVANGPIPTLAALLICDKLIEELGTGKKSLIGVFARGFTASFPMALSFAVYCRLADGEGKYPATFRISRTDGDGHEQVVIEVATEITIPNILEAFEFGINFVGVTFPALGRYDVQVYTGDIFLGHTSIDLAVLPVEG